MKVIGPQLAHLFPVLFSQLYYDKNAVFVFRNSSTYFFGFNKFVEHSGCVLVEFSVDLLASGGCGGGGGGGRR